MEYLFTFLEGIASFISPCLLPMIPIYIGYFIGENEKDSKKAIINSVGFVFGFTIIFILLSIFAISVWLKYIKIAFGCIIIALGLNYMELLKLKFLNKTSGIKVNVKNLNFVKSMMFGIVFSISWTPCIGSFLSSALLMVATHNDMVKGILLMLVYSIGLGIPFVLSVVLIERLKNVFSFIKKHFNVVKRVSGLILVVMGLYMIIF